MEIRLTYEKETGIRIRLELKGLAGMHCVISSMAIVFHRLDGQAYGLSAIREYELLLY